MSDTTQPNASPRPSNERSSSAAGEIDMSALVAAVERLLRRDIELDRERLRGGEGGDVW